MTEFGAIVVCGGRSQRMGRDKASLPFGPEEVMLQRVLRLLQNCAPPEKIAVVAAEGQALPTISPRVLVARDRQDGRGPLEGLAVGLAALGDRAEAVYATSCDVPLLVPEVVHLLCGLLDPSCDIVVPRDDQYHHPLAAVYRTRILPEVEALLREDQLRPRALFARCRTLEVPTDTLRRVDPELSTLWNLNTPDDYAEALRVAFGAESHPGSAPAE